MNIRRCKFFPMEANPRKPYDWELAEDGWFIGIFQDGESPVAVVEGFNGHLHRTFVEYVQFPRTRIDVLLEVILEEAQRNTAKSKWPEMEKFIKDQFIKYAFLT